MCQMETRGERPSPMSPPRHGPARCQNQSNHTRPSSSTPPPLPVPYPKSRATVTRPARPRRAPQNPIASVAGAYPALHRAASVRRGRGPLNQTRAGPGQLIPASGKWERCGARARGHGDDARRRRRIGVEGGRRGRRPARSLGLGRHPAAPLLRLPLRLLRVGRRFAHLPLSFSFPLFRLVRPGAIRAPEELRCCG